MSRFDRGWQQQSMGGGPPPMGQQSFGAPRSSGSIDAEAEQSRMMQQQIRMKAQEEANPMNSVMEAKRRRKGDVRDDVRRRNGRGSCRPWRRIRRPGTR
jgi:hypothetical protein